MFLHLRDFDNRPQSSRTGNRCHDIGSSLPELNFVQNRFLGNIGAPIETDQLEDDIEEATDDGFGLPHEEEYRRDTTTLVPVVSLSKLLKAQFACSYLFGRIGLR